MKHPRIVIIEDDVMFSGIYETTFTNAGFDVLMSKDGKAGFELLKKEKPDIVILDLMVPHLSGFEILQALRSNASLKDIPVIVVTNLDQHAERGRAMELGAKAYFVKAHAVFSDVLAQATALIK